MCEENARKLIRQLIKDGVVTDEILEKYEFMPHDIEDLKSDRNWECLYGNLISYEHKEASDRAVASVLGTDWKRTYEFKEHTDKKGFSLMLKVNPEEYEKICEVAREEYAKL